MLSAVVMQLDPVAEARLPLSHGAFAHAAAMDLFVRLDPALATALHDGQGSKPFTASLLGGDLPREGTDLCLAPGTPCVWRLTGLNREVSERLLDLSPQVGGVRLQNAVFRIAGIAADARDNPDAGRDTYAALQERWAAADPPSSVTLHFVTPTTFRTGRFEQPFPLARLVFGHLVDQWNTHSGLPFGDLRDLCDEGILLSNWRGETRRVELGGRRTVGFVGKFTYRAAEPVPSLQRLIGLLAEYARYAGVGWQTGHGMGQVRTDVRAAT